MVEVFKTNVNEERQREQILSVLAELFPGSRIDFDLEDCDKILRVEGQGLDVAQIMQCLRIQGYRCEVLD